MVEDRTHSDLELRKSPEIRETLIDTSSYRSGRYLFFNNFPMSAFIRSDTQLICGDLIIFGDKAYNFLLTFHLTFNLHFAIIQQIFLTQKQIAKNLFKNSMV